MIQHLSVAEGQGGIELDEFLARLFPRSKKRVLRELVRAGRVLVDGGAAQPSQHLHSDAVVSIDIEEEELEESALAPAPEPLVVLYEDSEVLAIDKPATLAVEPDRWDATRPSLIGALQALALERAAEEASFRPRIVHRLDRETSGVVLVAKTIAAERELGAAFEGGAIEKTYLALVEGEHPLPDGESELIDLPLGPDHKRSGIVCVRRDGKEARTRIRVEQRFRGFTLLACQPLTGRTHQLRVHLAATGFPLCVDMLYGRRRALLLSEVKADYRYKPGKVETPLIERLTLHASSIEFPRVGAAPERQRVEAPLPRDFQRVLKQMSKVRAPRR